MLLPEDTRQGPRAPVSDARYPKHVLLGGAMPRSFYPPWSETLASRCARGCLIYFDNFRVHVDQFWHKRPVSPIPPGRRICIIVHRVFAFSWAFSRMTWLLRSPPHPPPTPSRSHEVGRGGKWGLLCKLPTSIDIELCTQPLLVCTPPPSLFFVHRLPSLSLLFQLDFSSKYCCGPAFF